MYRSELNSPCFQRGFTLLELLIVTTILAIIASSGMVMFQNTIPNAQHDTDRYQMRQLADAVEAYYKDNGSFPTRDTPADVGFLFDQPAGTSDWNPDYRTGWRGPYLRGTQRFTIDIGRNLLPHGESRTNGSSAGSPTIGNILPDIQAVPDPYSHAPVGNFLIWGGINSTFGRPYLLIDLEILTDNSITPGVPRIVSFGENGIYEPIACNYSSGCTNNELCQGNGDDIVLCLR